MQPLMAKYVHALAKYEYAISIDTCTLGIANISNSFVGTERGKNGRTSSVLISLCALSSLQSNLGGGPSSSTSDCGCLIFH
jgi:hypothetical protein